MSQIFNDPIHWQNRAEAARAMADDMSDEIAKGAMLKIAESYELLAKRAEGRKIARDSNERR